MLSQEDRNGPPPRASHPLTELLACPSSIGAQLGAAAVRRDYAKGDVIFAQGADAEGLFLLLGGDFHRTADRKDTRLPLAPMHSGDLAELGAVLGSCPHTFTLVAASPAAALLFPTTILREAFAKYPPLQMHLLEELGREVSRSYAAISVNRRSRSRVREAASQ